MQAITTTTTTTTTAAAATASSIIFRSSYPSSLTHTEVIATTTTTTTTKTKTTVTTAAEAAASNNNHNNNNNNKHFGHHPSAYDMKLQQRKTRREGLRKGETESGRRRSLVEGGKELKGNAGVASGEGIWLRWRARNWGPREEQEDVR
ncbi:hypothetical protein E2C01_100696 [Portunus trituberculatus]|uniref:Uncharacterized protein n=1 Tax=Portunus trituberculatus TaxID=210409 RepID=A0A5B7KCV7_PORTR|nr:hypothetical protein [Portunus trituberculatus]